MVSEVPFERLHAVIVDNNRHMLRLVGEIFRGIGIRNIRALTSAQDVIEALSVQTADLVICDQEMSPMTGIELARFLRSHPDSPDQFIPIIMITALSESRTVEQARDAGINEYLIKPITPRAVYSRVLQIINHPRKFVRCEGYFGPDRRRQCLPHEGAEKRKTLPEPTTIERL